MSSTTTTNTSGFSVSIPQETDITDAMGWIKEEHADALTKELKDYLKCIKDNAPRFLALTDFGGMCGSSVSSYCSPVPKETIQRILHDFLKMVLTKNFKINGKDNDWSVGFLGNRWLDMDAESYGVDYIRVSFYSKKHYKGEVWRSDKPYHITIMVEKEKMDDE